MNIFKGTRERRTVSKINNNNRFRLKLLQIFFSLFLLSNFASIVTWHRLSPKDESKDWDAISWVYYVLYCYHVGGLRKRGQLGMDRAIKVRGNVCIQEQISSAKVVLQSVFSFFWEEETALWAVSAVCYTGRVFLSFPRWFELYYTDLESEVAMPVKRSTPISL